MATAEDILARVRTEARDAEVEVTVRTGIASLTRFANSFIHQNVSEDVSHVLLRVAFDGRNAASIMDGPVHPTGRDRLVHNAIEAARVAPPDPLWPGLTPPTPAPDVEHWDDETAICSPADRAQRVRAFVDSAGGLETAGFCSTTATTTAFANSAGQRLSGRATAAELDGIARTASADGSARLASVRLADIDGRTVGARAAAKARAASDPTDLPPGAYEVVLEPDCVANILSFLLIHGFNGRAVEDGRSFARIGEAQFDAAVTLRDEITDPRTVGIPFDVEGTPKRPLDLVRAGVTSGLLHTRRTAKAMGAGTESTGHAVEGGGPWGAMGANFVLAGGDRTDDQLVAGVERGLLVTDFWYTRILDPKSQVVTGLTRNGVWLVEDGRVVRPVANLRFTQSFVEALGPDRIRGLGAEPALVFNGWDSVYLVPAVHLSTWTFTGGAKG